MKKIVFIGFAQLTPILYEALCIDYFLDSNVEVDYLDITSLLIKNIIHNQSFKFVQKIDSYQELEKYIILNKNYNILYNIQFHYETRFFKFFKLLTIYDCRLSTFEIGYLPQLKNKKNVLVHLSRPTVLLRKLVNRILDKVYIKLGIINLEYDVKFTAGEVPYNLLKETTKQIVQINYVDYEKNIKLNKLNKVNKVKKYFVFLDNFLHKHTDHQLVETTRIESFDGKKYLETLNTFFLYIEKKYDTKIVIAAHPKSNYQDGEFFGREIIKNSTTELVLNATAVLAHHSTAISYAVLNKKPIIFIYTNEIKKYMPYVFLHTKAFANYLQMPCINLDQKYNIITIPSIYNHLYSRYKYDFLTTKNIERLNNKKIINQYVRSENALAL